MTSVRNTFGLCCPECGDDQELLVEVTTTVRILADGTDPCGDTSWNGASHIRCDGCGHSGTVEGFTVKGRPA
jgi:hypothetical protein